MLWRGRGLIDFYGLCRASEVWIRKRIHAFLCSKPVSRKKHPRKSTTMSDTKKELCAELDRRVSDKILEPTNAELLKKLIEKADSDNEAMMIAELGTTYKRTGLHFDKRLEKMTSDIRYFRKNEELSFHTDDSKPTHKLIIGDNYEALQNLLIQYRGKVDVIYIDPPYGKDKMGEFAQTNYENAITRDNLLSMLYPRLLLAKQLLSESGVIFCSIDDKNQAYVKCLFDEVFGEKNMITCFPKKGSGGRQDSTFFAIVHEYLLCYVKDPEKFEAGEVGVDKNFKFYDEDKKLGYNLQLLRKWGDNSRKVDRPNLFYPIYFSPKTNCLSLENNDESVEIYPMLDGENEGCWRWGKSTMEKAFADNMVEVQKKGEKYIPYERLYENPNEESSKLYSSWIDDIDNSTGSSLVKEVLPKEKFGYPKATDYLFKILRMANCKEKSVVLDFFAGSGTTGHAVLDYNEELGENQMFILCQSNEKTKDNPNGIAYDVTSKRLKRVMTGECYDGSKDFDWIKKNKPYGGNLDVYEIDSVANFESAEGKTPFDVIDETLYGKEKFKTLREKVEWVCQNFSNAQKTVENDDDYQKRTQQ